VGAGAGAGAVTQPASAAKVTATKASLPTVFIVIEVLQCSE
jgi:hypothetical protein